MTRHVYDRIVDVAVDVDMDAYETPGFYDKLERARTSGTFRPIEIVANVGTLVAGVLTSVGVSIALLTIDPLLAPLIGLAAVPLLLATLKNSRQAYLFEYQLTPQGRERTYLVELLDGPREREGGAGFRSRAIPSDALRRLERGADRPPEGIPSREARHCPHRHCRECAGADHCPGIAWMAHSRADA